MPATDRPKVRIHPVLAEATLAARLDRAYRLWLMARATDREGRGLAKLADVHEVCLRAGLKGVKAKISLRRIVDLGEGVFWVLFVKDGERWLHMISLAKVAAALQVERVSRPVEVEMPCKLKEFRALCVFARFGGDRMSNPISQAKIAERVGRNDRTIRNYQNELSALKTRRNAANTGQSWDPGLALMPGHYPGRVDNDIVVLRNLPCSYKLDAPVVGRSGTRKVNRSLQSQTSSHRLPRGQAERLFYRVGDRGVNRRIQGMGEGDVIFLEAGGNTRNGTCLWMPLQFVNGQLHNGACGAGPGFARPHTQSQGSSNSGCHWIM